MKNEEYLKQQSDNNQKVGLVEKGLDQMYNLALSGIPTFESISQIANEYQDKYSSKEKAIDNFINWQIAKCTTTGFVTGLGGIITFPVTIPLDLASSLLIQLRMIGVIATIRGYDVNSDQVRTFAYLALCGNAVNGIVKAAGIEFGVKYFSRSIMKRITKDVILKINKAVGFRLVTKAGTKGVINVGKILPVLGGFISGGLNWVETRIIANTAKKIFIDSE